LTRPETEGLALPEVNEMLVQKLQPVIEAEIRRLDPDLPTVLLAHLMADRATVGAEKFLAVGKGFTIPMSMLIRAEFDYVALGHVHKHQNLNPSNDPPVIYPGSIERVDFGEEKEDKGYILVEVESGQAEWEFCTLPARPFVTIEVDISQAEEPLEAVLEAIAKQDITEKVVRLIYKLRSPQLDLINTSALDRALQSAHSHSIRPELISQLARPRLPELGVGNTLNPLEALTTYLNNREDLKDIHKELLAAAEGLLASL
jgi:exonuclease SbcD